VDILIRTIKTKFLPPDTFSGLQICQNDFAAGAAPQNPLKERTRASQTPILKAAFKWPIRGGKGRKDDE